MAEKVEDLNLPSSIVFRILKDSIPENINISKEARAAFTKSASIFVLYVTSCANNFALKAKRKTLTASDVYNALNEMEFENFVEPLQKLLEARHIEKGKKDPGAVRPKKKRNENDPIAVPEDAPRTEKENDPITDRENDTIVDQNNGAKAGPITDAESPVSESESSPVSDLENDPLTDPENESISELDTEPLVYVENDKKDLENGPKTHLENDSKTDQENNVISVDNLTGIASLGNVTSYELEDVMDVD